MELPTTTEGEEPTLLTLPARRVAYHPMRGSLEELPAAVSHLQAWMVQTGLEPAGDAGIAYFANSGEAAAAEVPHWEVRCPVALETSEKTPDLTGCGIKTLDPVTVAVVRHRGAYAEIGQAYTRLLPWLMSKGRTAGWPMEEVFVPDPEAAPDAEDEDAFYIEVRVPIQS